MTFWQAAGVAVIMLAAGAATVIGWAAYEVFKAFNKSDKDQP